MGFIGWFRTRIRMFVFSMKRWIGGEVGDSMGRCEGNCGNVVRREKV